MCARCRPDGPCSGSDPLDHRSLKGRCCICYCIAHDRAMRSNGSNEFKASKSESELGVDLETSWIPLGPGSKTVPSSSDSLSLLIKSFPQKSQRLSGIRTWKRISLESFPNGSRIGFSGSREAHHVEVRLASDTHCHGTQRNQRKTPRKSERTDSDSLFQAKKVGPGLSH